MGKAMELKEKLGYKAKEIIITGLDLEEGLAGKYVCPMHVEDTASLSWFEAGNTFKCFGCGGTLDIYSYYTQYKGLTFDQAVAEVADILGEELSNINVNTLEGRIGPISVVEAYLKSRGIYLNTIEMDNQYITNIDGNLAFIHFGEYGIEGIRLRRLDNEGNKYWREKGSQFGLWMKSMIDVSRPVIITEGEIDNLTLKSLKLDNVTNYCSASNVSSLIRREGSFLKSLQRVLLITDNDKAGDNALAEFKQFFDANNVDMANIKFETDINNEVLNGRGEQVFLTIQDALSNMYDIEDVDEFSKLDYTEPSNIEQYGVEFGIPKVDYALNDMAFGSLNILYGRTGAGKTTITGQSILSAIRQNTKTFIFNGELSKDMFQEWVYTQSLQDERYLKTVKKNKRYISIPQKKYQKYIDEWLEGKLYVYSRKRLGGHHNDVIEAMVKLIKKGIKYFVIDNLMSVLKTTAASQYKDQQDFVQTLKDFAELYKVTVLLIVHPNKDKDRGERLTLKDIKGSGDIFNIADNVLAIERAYDEFVKSIDEYNNCEGILRILKARETADLGYVQLSFDTKRRSFTQLDGVTYGPLGWEKYIEETEEEVKSTVQLDNYRSITEEGLI